MKSITLKRIIVIISVSISLLIFLQMYLLYKQYVFEEKILSASVTKAIRGYYEDFGSKNGLNIVGSVEYPARNVFIFNVSDTIPPERLMIDSLVSELRQVNIFTGYQIQLYQAKQDRYAFMVSVNEQKQEITRTGLSAPRYSRDFDYISLVFTNPEYYIFRQMIWLIVLSIVLTLFLVGLGISLFYLYKQKFLVETQHDFIRNITHEFQTPLSTLMIGLDSLEKPAVHKDPVKLSKYISLMQAQVKYLNQHIINLVNSVKADQTGLHINKTDCSLNEIIEEAIQQLAVPIEEKKAKIIFNPEKENKLVQADADMMFIVFINILSNALKYASNPVIEITTEQVSTTSYRITVKDNGIGIEEKYQKKIFEKFYRVSTGNTHDVKGLGLGLYFVKKIIDAHHGRLTLSSHPNDGTSFIIQLPLKHG